MNILRNSNISGAIGLTRLEKDGKEFYIFYDQHNNKEYCKTDNSQFLDSILEKNFLNDNTLIILEELVDFDNNVISIWKDTYHTTKFKEFYLKHKHLKNVVPFDLRTILFPISPYLILNYNDDNLLNDFDINKDKFELSIENLDLEEYFYLFFYFFNLVEKNQILHQKYNTIIKNIKKIKKRIIKCFKKLNYKDDIFLHYKLIKNVALYFKNKYYDANPKLKLKEFVKANSKSYKSDKVLNKILITSNLKELDIYSWYDYLEILLDYIIEFYAILLIFCYNKQYTFIHSGLVHSSNIVRFLENHYKFKNNFTSGVTSFSDIDNQLIIKNCIGI